jgi:hypothetical protein
MEGWYGNACVDLVGIGERIPQHPLWHEFLRLSRKYIHCGANLGLGIGVLNWLQNIGIIQ